MSRATSPWPPSTPPSVRRMKHGRDVYRRRGRALSGGALLGRLQLEHGRVDAVTLPGRAGAVVEDVPEMRLAGVAEHLGAPHPEAAVRLLANIFAGDRGGKARPAGAGVELGL